MSEHAFLFAKSDDDVGFSMFAPRICKGGDGGTTLFRSARSDEDGGNPANIAASGASNQTQRDARAANLKNGPGLRWGARCGTSTMDGVWR
jgi:hypothetical protein